MIAEVWRIHRKFINPSFHIKILQSLLPIFNEKSRVLLKVIEQYEGAGEFDVLHCLSACTLETLFGKSLKDIFELLFNAFEKIFI